MDIPFQRFCIENRFHNLVYAGAILRSKSVRHLLSESKGYKNRIKSSIFIQKDKNGEYKLTIGILGSHNPITRDKTIRNYDKLRKNLIFRS